MGDGQGIRWGWLKFMYAYTIAVAGAMGVALIVAPTATTAMFGWPEQDPVVMGVMASVYVAFGLISVLGLRAPLKFVPILCLQLVYKVIWLLFVLVPLALATGLPSHAAVFIAIFASYIVGDLIAIPFAYVFDLPAESREPSTVS